MPDLDTVRSWQGATMVDPDGDKIGTIDAIYVDDQTGEPEWALVNTGLFGTKSSFVPLAQATSSGDQVQVPYDKQLVKDAPRIDPDQHLSEAEEQQLWRHSGLDYQAADTDTDRDGVFDDVQDTGVGRDTSGPTTDDAMTRSEEELQVLILQQLQVVKDQGHRLGHDRHRRRQPPHHPHDRGARPSQRLDDPGVDRLDPIQGRAEVGQQHRGVVVALIQ